MSSGLNKKVKNSFQSQRGQEQEYDQDKMSGENYSDNENKDVPDEAVDSGQVNNAESEILDLSYIKTFGEAYRQAKLAGAQQFRWKPDRNGDDIYTCGNEQEGAGIATKNVPNENGKPVNTPVSGEGGKEVNKDARGNEDAGQEKQSGGLMSKVKKYFK